MTDVMQCTIYAQTLTQTFEEKPATITLENDNIPALDMIQALDATKMSKFIDMRHQYIKQTVREKNIKLQQKPSRELKADIFT